MGEEEAEQKQKQQSNSEMEVEEITAKESREQVVQDYSWPVIRFDVPPVRTYHFCYQFRNTSSNPNNFPYGIKWSPDGSCFLTCTDEKSLRVFPLPDAGSLYHENSCSFAADVAADSYTANLVVNEGEPVYDFCWYPYMSASDPVTCVFASTTRDHPIHLWDATSGELRCTYRAYNDVDEITAAYCIGFNPAGTKIFAGYNKSLRIFDIHRPGRDSVHHSTVKGNNQQPGIISSIAFSPSHTGMLATGSYGQTTAIYREDNMELLYILHGQQGGVRDMCNSQKMVTIYIQGGNRTLTYSAGTYAKLLTLCLIHFKLSYAFFFPSGGDGRSFGLMLTLGLYRSSENTNQRILFDIDPFGQHLGTGSEDGLVHIYNLQMGQWVSSFQAALGSSSGKICKLQ